MSNVKANTEKPKRDKYTWLTTRIKKKKNINLARIKLCGW